MRARGGNGNPELAWDAPRDFDYRLGLALTVRVAVGSPSAAHDRQFLLGELDRVVKFHCSAIVLHELAPLLEMILSRDG